MTWSGRAMWGRNNLARFTSQITCKHRTLRMSSKLGSRDSLCRSLKTATRFIITLKSQAPWTWMLKTRTRARLHSLTSKDTSLQRARRSLINRVRLPHALILNILPSLSKSTKSIWRLSFLKSLMAWLHSWTSSSIHRVTSRTRTKATLLRWVVIKKLFITQGVHLWEQRSLVLPQQASMRMEWMEETLWIIPQQSSLSKTVWAAATAAQHSTRTL